MKFLRRLISVFVLISVSLSGLAFAQDASNALNDVRKLCSGGFGTLAEGERATITYKDNTVEVASGNRVFVSDEAGNFTRQISDISFSEYTACLERMIEILGLGNRSSSNFFHRYTNDTPIATIAAALSPPIAEVSNPPLESAESFHLFRVSDDTEFFVVVLREGRVNGVFGDVDGAQIDSVTSGFSFDLLDMAYACSEASTSGLEYRRPFFSFRKCWFGRPGKFLSYEASYDLEDFEQSCVSDAFSLTEINDLVIGLVGDAGISRRQEMESCLEGVDSLVALSFTSRRESPSASYIDPLTAYYRFGSFE